MAGRAGSSCSRSLSVAHHAARDNLLAGGDSSPLSGEKGVALGVAR